MAILQQTAAHTVEAIRAIIDNWSGCYLVCRRSFLFAVIHKDDIGNEGVRAWGFLLGRLDEVLVVLQCHSGFAGLLQISEPCGIVVTWPLGSCPQLGGFKMADTVTPGQPDYWLQPLLKHWGAGWGMQEHPARVAADILWKSAVSCDLLWAQSQQTSSDISTT